MIARSWYDLDEHDQKQAWLDYSKQKEFLESHDKVLDTDTTAYDGNKQSKS